ncbi:MAG: hypothetical protein H0V89_12270, partial [Deltaproteobacteria bacterium]|nr:hypothetical protein [Deltaproteobacteria bacterium]
MTLNALLLALACAPAAPPADSDEVAPETAAEVFARLAAPGPHAVGYREDSLAWDDPDTGPRANRLAVWWPTDAETGIEARYWR